eukprot:m.207772 g.207772  ORF g.207772 m.207772 type:complete len:842 (+) comp15030_c1_seq2:158-2683(+)
MEETVSSYLRSCDIWAPVAVKIASLDGMRRPRVDSSGEFVVHSQHGLADLCCECHIISAGRAQCLPVRTSYRHFEDQEQWMWNEWIELPILYRDLTRDSQLVIAVKEAGAPGQPAETVGSTHINMFDAGGLLHAGTTILKLASMEETTSVEMGTVQMTASLIHKHVCLGQLQQIQQHSTRFVRGEVVSIPWLDRLTSQAIADEAERLKLESDELFLSLVFPCMKHATLYCELAPTTAAVAHHDPDLLFVENLIEMKHHVQMLTLEDTHLARDLKPNPVARDRLTSILSQWDSNPSIEEKDLLWKYRFFLARDKAALPKVLSTVDWTDVTHVRRVQEVLRVWEHIDMSVALELLVLEHAIPRNFAVRRLQEASNAELSQFLLQLVAALKYDFPEARADAAPVDKSYAAPTDTDEVDLAQSDASVGGDRDPDSDSEMSLKGLLIERAKDDGQFAQRLYWFLQVEATDTKSIYGQRYASVLEDFKEALQQGTDHSRAVLFAIRTSVRFLQDIIELSEMLHKMRVDRIEMISRLNQMLEDPKYQQYSATLPMDPSIIVEKIVAGDAHVFKSKLMPVRLTLGTNKGDYRIIFKNGDDLRQDQLVLQVIELMDSILQAENLDLKLSCYGCLAASAESGMLQCVPESYGLADILSDYKGSIRAFLQKHNPDPSGPFGIAPHVMDNYVRSNAGYAVITYLLGIGDRHLDNVMLTSDGKLLHIDFGYFLGRDPKPYPPPIKLTKEMIDAMGGADSEYVRKFRSYCYICFLILRRHAKLFRNLFALMKDSNVCDIAIDRDKTITKLLEKFCLDLDDERAIKHFQEQLHNSLAAVFPKLVEAAHSFAQLLRK